MKTKIILASASRRRSRILRECSIPHTIMISNVTEASSSKKNPPYYARLNAINKASSIAQRCKTGYIIGADTVVSLGQYIIGKPQSLNEARLFLEKFSAKTLTVHTGLCVINVKKGKKVSSTVSTKIHVRKLSKKMINKIIEVIDPLDRAGGFSIEGIGSYMFDNIQGSFYNVLGLPMNSLYDLFAKLGVDLTDFA